MKKKQNGLEELRDLNRIDRDTITALNPISIFFLIEFAVICLGILILLFMGNGDSFSVALTRTGIGLQLLGGMLPLPQVWISVSRNRTQAAKFFRRIRNKLSRDNLPLRRWFSPFSILLGCVVTYAMVLGTNNSPPSWLLYSLGGAVILSEILFLVLSFIDSESAMTFPTFHLSFFMVLNTLLSSRLEYLLLIVTIPLFVSGGLLQLLATYI